MSRGVKCQVWMTEDGRPILGEEGAELLAEVREKGSLATAAEAVGMTFLEAREVLSGIEEAIGNKVVFTMRGTEGSVTALTAEGEALLEEYRNKKRRVEEQLEHMFRNPTLTADGIVLVNGRIVLIRRGNEPGKGRYALPGGFVEYGERLEDCAVREVLEETGLRTEPLDLVGMYSDPNRDPRGHLVSAVFFLRSIGGELKAGDDAQSVELFDLDRLPPLAFDHKRIISDFMRSRSLGRR
jgi:8-oxo-dGTP diphosphatase